MRNLSLVPIILCGGIGSRLWPLSQAAKPKPFIRLNDGLSLLQKTYMRAADLPWVKEIVTVTNRDLLFRTRDEFAQLSMHKLKNTFLLEPFPRNSAAAIAVAAQYVNNQYGESAIILALPADHLIEDSPGFITSLAQAISLASNSKLVTFGIKPDSPKTEFGYIETEQNSVIRFIEKPNKQMAQEFISSNKFFWNSGMFCVQAGAFNKELQKTAPAIADASAICFKNASNAQGDGWQHYEIRTSDFQSMPDISVDYALFEKSKNIAMVECDIKWRDIGSWTEFGSLLPPDNLNNHIMGNALLQEVQDCIIYTEQKVVAALGIKDLIIANTQNGLLVAHKDKAQEVRKITALLKETQPNS